MRYGKLGLILTAAVLTTAVSVASFAQGPQPGQPGARQGRGQGGGGQRGQRGGMNVAMIPVSYLATELKLNDSQKTKISAIQTKLQSDLKALAPTPGQQPDPQTRQQNGQKRQQLNQAASKDIEAVLTDTQKAKIPELTKSLQSFFAVGIPVGSLGALNLTSDQKTKIAKIASDAQAAQQGQMQAFQAARQSGDQAKQQSLMQDFQKQRQQTHEKAVAVLTSTQKSALDKYMKDHPQPQFGGRGGRGPGGGGGGFRGNRGGGNPSPILF